MWIESSRRGFNRGGILIDASDVRAALEEGESVSASSERAVQDMLNVAEQLGDLVSENWRVKGWKCGWLGHRNGVNLVSMQPVSQVFDKLRVVQPA